MDRRKFLGVAAAVPVAASLPAMADEQINVIQYSQPNIKCDQGWPKLLIGDTVAKSELHGGFLLTVDTQTIDGMVIKADDNEYTVSLIEAPDRLYRRRA